MVRLVSGVVLGALTVALTIGASSAVFNLLVVFLVGVGALEFYSAHDSPGSPFLAWIGSIFAMGLTCAFAFGDARWVGLALLSGGAIFMIDGARGFESGSTDLLRRVGSRFFIACYVAVPLSFLIFLRAMDGGVYWLLFLFALIVATDAGAYYVGRRFGERKLAPSISPGKTLEGFAGGFSVSLIVGVLGGVALEDAPIFLTAALGALVGLVGPVGDLSASALKRSLGVKDFGRSIPGHGGALDRLDTFLSAAPVFYLALLIWG